MPRSAPFGALAVAVGALLFALNGTAAKLAMQAGLSTTRLVELRSVGAAVILMVAALVVVRGRIRLRARELALMAVLGIIGVALVQWFYLIAISRLPVGLALLIEYTEPLLVALWARFALGEPVRVRMWWALGACLAGLALVAQVPRGIVLDPIGVAAAAGAALCLATYYLLGERLLTRRDPLSMQGWSFAFAAAFWLVVQPLQKVRPGTVAAEVPLPGVLDGVVPLWMLVAWIVVLGTAVPYLLLVGGLTVIGAVRTGLIAMLEPVAASAAAWVVLGEEMTLVQLVGGAVVLAGIGLAETARRGRRVADVGELVSV